MSHPFALLKRMAYELEEYEFDIKTNPVIRYREIFGGSDQEQDSETQTPGRSSTRTSGERSRAHQLSDFFVVKGEFTEQEVAGYKELRKRAVSERRSARLKKAPEPDLSAWIEEHPFRRALESIEPDASSIAEYVRRNKKFAPLGNKEVEWLRQRLSLKKGETEHLARLAYTECISDLNERIHACAKELREKLAANTKEGLLGFSLRALVQQHFEMGMAKKKLQMHANNNVQGVKVMAFRRECIQNLVDLDPNELLTEESARKNLAAVRNGKGALYAEEEQTTSDSEEEVLVLPERTENDAANLQSLNSCDHATADESSISEQV